MKKFFILLTLTLFITSTAYAKKRTCKTFKDHDQAQRYFNAHKPGWQRLDGDKDGEACECLRGGSGYNRSVCIEWRKRHRLR